MNPPSEHDWRASWFSKDVHCARCPETWHLGRPEPQTPCTTKAAATQGEVA